MGFLEEGRSTVSSAVPVLNPATPDFTFELQLTVQTLSLMIKASVNPLLMKKNLSGFHKGVLNGVLRFS